MSTQILKIFVCLLQIRPLIFIPIFVDVYISMTVVKVVLKNAKIRVLEVAKNCDE